MLGTSGRLAAGPRGRAVAVGVAVAEVAGSGGGDVLLGAAQFGDGFGERGQPGEGRKTL